MRCVLSVLQCLAILFSLQVSTPLTASAQPLSKGEQALHDHLQHLDHTIDRSLRRAQVLATIDGSPAAELAEEARRLHRHLNQLEADVHGWDPARQQGSLERLRALDLAVEKMEAAAEALHRDHDALEGSRWRAALPHGSDTAVKGTPANDGCADATVITDGISTGDTSSATNDGSAFCGNSSFAPDVWFKYTAPVDGEVFVNTFGSAFDTVLSVHRGCPSPDSEVIRCNDNQGGLQSALGFFAQAGTEYTIRVAGFAGASGPFQLEIGPGGTISGSVTDAASGDPIASATVSVKAQDGYRLTTTTDDAGHYVFTGLEYGSYRAYIRDAAPYAPEVYNGLPCSGACDPESGTPIEVGPSSVVTGIDFALDLGGSIAGTVVEAGSGEPIPSVWVEIWDDEDHESVLARTLTDTSGHYSVEGLAAGAYFASVSSSEHMNEVYDDHPCPGGPPYGCNLSDGELIQVALGAATTGIDFALDRLGAISGLVTDVDRGEPLAFIDVFVYNEDGGFVGSDSTDDNGRYTVGGLLPGTYFARTESFYSRADEIYDDIPCFRNCDPTSGTPIAVASGITEGIDFALGRLGVITGTVTDEASGEPAHGRIRIFVWNERGEFVTSRQVFSPLGDYSIIELPPGNHFVTTNSEDDFLPSHLYLDELYDDLPCFFGAPIGCDPTTGMPVAVNGGAVTSGIDFALVRSGAISGTVTAEATGEPLSNVSIVVFDQAGDQVANVGSEAGTYRFFGLPTGSYFVGAFSGPWISEIYDDIPCEDPYCDPTFGTPVAVSLGAETSGINFALAQDGGITGTVTDVETGDGLANHQVVLYEESGYSYRTANTDTSGDYQFLGVTAGSYFVRVDGHNYGSDGPSYRGEVYDDIPCAIECDPTIGTPVVVGAEGLTTGIDFALDLLGSISGTVTDAATGEPIRDASISIFDAVGRFVRSDTSDASGNFTVFGAPVGNVFALAREFSYVRELYADQPCDDDCDATAGTPIPVRLGEAVAGIDFTLDRPGSISGMVINAATGNPAQGIDIEIWDESGDSVSGATTDQVGRYLVGGLFPGTYFVTARAAPFLGELYPDLPCPLTTCDPTTGAPVPVSHGNITGGIDFELTLAGVISGQTTDAETGEEISADVTLWDADGNIVQSTSDGSRYAFVGISAGTYYISASEYEYHHQLYDHVPCPGGPPMGCDPTSGTPVIVTDNSYQRIDFALARLCSPSDVALCLNDRRFRVEVAWEDFDNNTGLGNSFDLTDDSGYFWFFGEDNVEIVVKVLDACTLPGFNSFWVFAGGLTNVAAELTVTDTVSGEIQAYENPLGAPFQPIQDTGAFTTCDAGRSPTAPAPQDQVGAAYADFERQLAALTAPAPPIGIPDKACGGDSGLCLADGRFRVEARWQTQEGESGDAQPVPLTDATGYFWFFDDDNVEAIVKVLDACTLDGFNNFWFFAAGLTDVEVILTVTDTESGEVQEYMNPQGVKFQPVQDTGSFRTCP